MVTREDIRRCQQAERRKLAEARARWRLLEGPWLPRIEPGSFRRVLRGREHRYAPSRAASGSSGSDDPHIAGASPACVVSDAAREA